MGREGFDGAVGAMLDGGMGPLNIAILYPTPDAGEDDFLVLAGRMRPRVDADIVYMPWPDDRDLSSVGRAGVMDALRQLGSDEHLARVVPDALVSADVHRVRGGGCLRR